MTPSWTKLDDLCDFGGSDPGRVGFAVAANRISGSRDTIYWGDLHTLVTNVNTGSSSTQQITCGHSDCHAIAFSPFDPNTVYMGTDGGLSSYNIQTPNAPVNNLNNGLGLMLEYHIASSEQDPYQILDAEQDNSFSYDYNGIWSKPTFGGWVGDGTWSMIDYQEHTQMYVTSTYCQDCQFNTGGGIDAATTNINPSFGNYINSSCERRVYGPPTFSAIDPTNHNLIYQGREDVVENPNGVNATDCLSACSETGSDCWNAVGNSGGTYNSSIERFLASQLGGDCVVGDGTKHGDDEVYTMAIAPTDNNRIYVSVVADPNACPNFPCQLLMSTDAQDGGSATWQLITPSNSSGLTITGIAVSPYDEDSIWITYSGYGAGHKVAVADVSKSYPNGWPEIGNDLPNVPVNCIAYQNGSNNSLYIGTDVGVYYYQNGANLSGSWQRVGGNFPNVIVNWLDVNNCYGKIRAATFGRGAWEDDLVPPASSRTQIVSGTWSGVVVAPGSIEITSGNSLTISSGADIQMPKNSRIIVDRGATLNVYGTVRNACGAMWAGIDVAGTYGAPQNATNSGYVILNNATIENAYDGISTIKIDGSGNADLNYTGGVIRATNSEFLNCGRDVQFLYYHNPNNSNANLSYFTNCKFYTTQYPLNDPSEVLKGHVTMWDVHGVLFEGDDFENQTAFPSLANSQNRGDGIISIDASYNITGTPSGIVSNFSGLSYGIYATSTLGYPFNVIPNGSYQNTFTNNVYDIYSGGTKFAYIQNNNFTKGDMGALTSPTFCNVFMDNSTHYSVQGNSFNITSTSAPMVNASAVANQCGPVPCSISNNHFYPNDSWRMEVGTQVQGANGQGSNGQGLSVQCNTYQWPINSADINVPGHVIDQGSPATPAGNEFSHTCGADLNAYYNNDFTYWYNSSSTQETPYASCSYDVIIAPSSATNSCTISSGGGSPNTHRMAENAYQHTADSLNIILAAGNSSNLYGDLALLPARIQDSLLAPGPYLSDSLMEVLIGTDIPFDTLRNILVPNAPLNNSVLTAFDGNAFYTSLQRERIDTISGVSAREKLQGNIGFYMNEAGLEANAIASYYLNDTIGDTIAGAIDSAIAALHDTGTGMSHAQLAELVGLQCQKGDTTGALRTDSILSGYGDTNYTKFCTLMPILIHLQSDSDKYFALSHRAADSGTVAQIAMDSDKPGYVQARAVMTLVFNKQYAPYIAPFSIGGSRYVNPNSKTPDSVINNTFRLFPNPAADKLTIAYSLNSNVEHVDMVMYDILGNQAANYALPPSGSPVTENTANLPPGFYVYKITVDGNIVQRGKLVIER